MHKKVAGYSLLSVVSFCFFTLLFHTVVNAQTPDSPFVLAQKTQPEHPTPTIYSFAPQTHNQQNTVTHQPTQTTQANNQANPTPTIYTAPTGTPTPEQPTATPTLLPTNTPFPTPTSAPTIAVVVDLEALFTKYSNEFGADKEMLKKIARCESGFNTNSNNSGMYLGMFQFAAPTWISTRGAMGLDTNPELRTNAEEAIKTAAYMISKGRHAAWPNCH